MHVDGDSGRIRTHGTDTSCHTSFQVMAVMTSSVRYHIGCSPSYRPKLKKLMRLPMILTIRQLYVILSVLRA